MATTNKEIMNPPSFLRLAKKASRLSQSDVKVGAVLANKRPISVGYNKNKTHTKYANPNKHLRISIHAEMACVIGADGRVEDGTLYVYREDSKGSPRMSRPCEQCMAYLKEIGISKVVYTVPKFPYWKEEEI